MEKYLTFDCYGTLLNEEATYAAIKTIADKIGVDPRLARQRFITYQDNRDNMHPYPDYAILTRNNLIHLDYQFGLSSPSVRTLLRRCSDCSSQLNPLP